MMVDEIVWEVNWVQSLFARGLTVNHEKQCTTWILDRYDDQRMFGY
jgi:hypothetical protein